MVKLFSRFFEKIFSLKTGLKNVKVIEICQKMAQNFRCV